METQISVLLDTDIGTNIDDAIALAYLLKHPGCRLVGISVVTGDVAKRAACAFSVLESYGREDVPIVQGASELLGARRRHSPVLQYQAASLRARRQGFADDAVEFMQKIIRSRPGEITLLSIGPLTNVASLFSVDPHLPSLLKAYVSMSGNFAAAVTPDTNAAVDPKAASIVYQLSRPGHLSVGYEVTRTCRMSADTARTLFRGADNLMRILDVWLASNSDVPLHDPLAAVCLLHPTMFMRDEGEVTVSLKPGSEGSTAFTPNRSGRHGIVTSIHCEEAKDEIQRRLKHAGNGSEPVW